MTDSPNYQSKETHVTATNHHFPDPSESNIPMYTNCISFVYIDIYINFSYVIVYIYMDTESLP